MEKMNKKRSKRIYHDLPEAMIQHIQSFMAAEEASRTSLLSKSWYNAWLTRPTLDFSIDDASYFHEFQQFATNTIQRYQNSNTKIQSLNLIMSVPASKLRRQQKLLASTIIAAAINIGAIHLNLKLPQRPPFLLPLTSQTLATLSVNHCEIEVEVEVEAGAAESSRCSSSLKSLSFERVRIRSDDVFTRVASSSSSSMEELSLSRCYGGAALSRTNMFEFPKLKRLLLNRVIVKPNFFTDFASRFPCLKDLTLTCCGGHRRVRIAAASLEHVTYAPRKMLPGSEFDVRNIRKFAYAGRGLPPPSLCVDAGEWEFELRIKRCSDIFRCSWLLNLNKSLRKFGEVRICLSLHLVDVRKHLHDVRETRIPNPLPEAVLLQSLNTNISRSSCGTCYDLLFCLFKVVGKISIYK